MTPPPLLAMARVDGDPWARGRGERGAGRARFVGAGPEKSGRNKGMPWNYGWRGFRWVEGAPASGIASARELPELSRSAGGRVGL